MAARLNLSSTLSEDSAPSASLDHAPELRRSSLEACRGLSRSPRPPQRRGLPTLHQQAWQLPLSLGGEGRGAIEPLAPLQDAGDEAARHEAAFKLVGNHQAVAKFAARGAGEAGRPQFQAPLADPYATPNEALVPAVDTLLRHTAHALLHGTEAAAPAAAEDLGTGAARPALASCLAYLRDRVGVPRDMGQAAAMHFRAHLNWMIGQL